MLCCYRFTEADACRGFWYWRWSCHSIVALTRGRWKRGVIWSGFLGAGTDKQKERFAGILATYKCHASRAPSASRLHVSRKTSAVFSRTDNKADQSHLGTGRIAEGSAFTWRRIWRDTGRSVCIADRCVTSTDMSHAALGDSIEFIGAIQINLSIYLSIYLGTSEGLPILWLWSYSGRVHVPKVLSPWADLDPSETWFLGSVRTSERTTDVNKATSVKARPQTPRPQPHVATALPVQDNAHRMNQHLRSSQVLATFLTTVNSHWTATQWRAIMVEPNS